LLQVANPESEYQQLKTELMICTSGGLFLGLYQDSQIPSCVINRLQNDLPNQFNFELFLNKDKTNFPVFFRYLFEEFNQQASVYHVLGIDQLEPHALSDFLKNLQYNRDNFKALSYSLIFWIKANFVSTLFHAAPDFYHWLFGSYDFSFQPQQQPEFINHCLQAQQQLDQQEQQFLAAIHTYLEKLIWQYEHWQEVKDSGKDFLNEVMSRADLNRYYVSLHCTDQYNKTWLLDDLLNQFLANYEQSFLALLGDFGTGKSSFSLHYFIQQARRYLQDSTQRIPLFISLKDYPKRFELAEFLEKEFFQRLHLPFHAKALQTLVLQGRFLFFFDGFDEMVSMASEQETIDNFRTITRLSFENLQLLTQKNQVASNKLFLTCRGHYFLTNTQEQYILKADKTVLYRKYATKTQYQISRIAIQEFKQEQIEQYIRKNTDSEENTQKFIKIIETTYNLDELSSRPLLLSIIIKTFPLLKDKLEINAADLYRVYTSEWIERDDWRSCLTIEGKRQTMWSLAIKMYQKGGDFSLHYSELDQPNQEYFKTGKYNSLDKDYFIYETTNCSFLNRTSKGEYKFIHKSFMEYFLAEYLFFYEIKKDFRKMLKELLNIKEIGLFFKYILCSNKLHLSNVNLSFLKLPGINLQGANLEGANLESICLENANLEDANIKEANFIWADIRGINAEKANLYKTNLYRANICRAKLSEANLEGANLEGANLLNCNLFEANLEGANLYNARYIGNLSNANLFQTNFYLSNYDASLYVSTKKTTSNYYSYLARRYLRSAHWFLLEDIFYGLLDKKNDTN